MKDNFSILSFKLLLLIYFFTMDFTVYAQDVTIRGYIIDARTRTPIELAIITLESDSLRHHFSSDKNGTFSMAIIPQIRVNLAIRRFGYASKFILFKAETDTTIYINLEPEPLNLESISIISRKESRAELAQKTTQPVFHIGLKEMDEIAAMGTAAVLNFAPGVYIKNYGGYGGLKTISLRGMSASQSKILIDGVEYDNFQTGVTDLSTLDLHNFQAINVRRGGDAARFGANALAGTIDLVTLPASSVPSIRYSSGLGAYGETVQKIRLSFPFLSLDATTAASLIKAQGNYRFRYNAFGEKTIQNRTNDDFENRNVLLSLRKKKKNVEAALTGLFYSGERGVPGPVLQGTFAKSTARQKDKDLQITGRVYWQPSSDSFLRTAIRWRKSELKYRDPQIKFTPQGINDIYDNSTVHSQTEYEALRRNQRLISKFEFGQSELNGNNLARPKSTSYELINTVKRTYTHTSLFWEFIKQKQGIYRALQLALRMSTYSDMENAFCPSIGFNTTPFRFPLHLRMHIAKNFRVPSFAELYYLNYGNQSSSLNGVFHSI